MIRSLYNSVSSMIALENKQNTTIDNMTNANTIGYKSQNLAMKSFEEVLIQNRDKVVGSNNVKQTIGSLSLGAKIDTVINKFTQGDLKPTEKQTDFGISGRGFFVIQSGNNQVYTRDGNFTVNSLGNLVTTTGDNVLGVNTATGAVGPIFVGNSKFTIGDNNTININGVSTQSLLTADFADYSKLKKIGDNYYVGENPINNATVNVKQGYTESSNVNVTNEMVDMLTNMRSFETNQKMIAMLDETLNKAANEVGAVR